MKPVDSRPRQTIGCPNFALKKFRFKAKLSETETVLLRFASVSQNHKIKVLLRKFRFVLLKKRFALVVSQKKKFRFKSLALKIVSLRK